MAGNTMTLTIAGEPRGALDAFDRVGSGARDMGRQVGQSADSFERARDRADEVDTKAMGFRDTLTGIQDGAEGVRKAASGDWGFETLLLLGFGIGDLASGLTNFMIPAMKTFTGAVRANTLAMLASPITWIILGIAALIAVIVLIAVKTDWFSRAWRASWDWIRRAAGASWDFIRSKSMAVWDWLQSIPGRLRSTFSRVADFISAPFRSAFNAISRAWNGTVGRLSWSVPSWVPGIGGHGISAPRLPTFHTGGVVPGAPGEVVPIMAMAGERVRQNGAGATGSTVVIGSDGSAIGDALIELLSQAVRRQGGDVQLVLGGANA